MNARSLKFALSICCSVALFACEAPPPTGDSSGRLGSGVTTPAEMRSGQMYLADLNEASDRVAEALMKDLNDLAENEFKQDGQAYEVTLVYGDIANKTRNMSTQDFEIVRERIRDTLMGSKEFRRHFRVVESKARYESLRAREHGDQGGRELNPGFTYFLNANVFSAERGDTRQFYMNFQLLRDSDAEIVFTKKYEQNYR